MCTWFIIWYSSGIITRVPPTAYLTLLIQWMGVVAVTLILGASPVLQRRRPVKFVYPLREGLVALSLALLAAGLQFLYYSQTSPVDYAAILPATSLSQLFSVSAPGNFSSNMLEWQLGFSGVLALPFLLALFIRRQPWLSAGASRPLVRAGLYLGLALGLITIFLAGKTYSILNGLSTAQWTFLAASAVAALSQEFVFRGYIQLRLAGWIGNTYGWIATAVLFTLWQFLLQLIAGRTAPANLGLNLAALFVFALILGWIMRKCGNILAPAIYHAIVSWLMVL